MLTINSMRAIPHPKFAIGSTVIYKPRGSGLEIKARILDHQYSKMRGYIYLLEMPGEYIDNLILEVLLKPID